MMDVPVLMLQHLVQHQELDVFHYLIAPPMQYKLVVVSKELTETVSGIQQQLLKLPHYQLQPQVFAD